MYSCLAVYHYVGSGGQSGDGRLFDFLEGLITFRALWARQLKAVPLCDSGHSEAVFSIGQAISPL